MKTGIELIAIERQEQIEKHGRSIDLDAKNNTGEYEIDSEVINNPQLASAARILTEVDGIWLVQMYSNDIFVPHGWNKDIWNKMLNKTYKERLIIAGALIAAEIDRLQHSDSI